MQKRSSGQPASRSEGYEFHMAATRGRSSTAAPFPVFNRNKRPRQALFAHPNSIMNEEQTHQYASRMPTIAEEQSTTRPYPSFGGAQGCIPSHQHSANHTSHFERNMENLVHHAESGQVTRRQLDRGRRTPLAPLQQYEQPARQFNPSLTEPRACPSLQPPSDQYQSHTGVGLNQWPSQSVATVESNTTRIEPPAVMGTATTRPGLASRSNSSMRVLTSTAQGIHHWSQFCSLPFVLLFEVFGVLDSQVSVGDYGSKQFMLKTNGRALKCCFWEMDIKLPHLVRGRTHRVVGTWDVRNKFLKCVSVRPALPSEERHISTFVEASNAIMKEITSITSEL